MVHRALSANQDGVDNKSRKAYAKHKDSMVY